MGIQFYVSVKFWITWQANWNMNLKWWSPPPLTGKNLFQMTLQFYTRARMGHNNKPVRVVTLFRRFYSNKNIHGNRDPKHQKHMQSATVPCKNWQVWGPLFPCVCNGLFLIRNFAFLLNSAWLIDPWSCFLLTWIIRKIIDIVLHCQSGPLKRFVVMGLKRKGFPLLIEKLFCLILQAQIKAIAVTRDSLEIILWALRFCFPSFFYLSL